jgi:PKD repeat protein
MKKLYLLVILISISLLLNADNIKYPDHWGKQGLSVVSQSNRDVTINFSIELFGLSNKQLNGETVQELTLPGVFLPGTEGAPNLPAVSRFIALPEGATAKLTIISFRNEVIENVDVEPSPRIPWDTEEGPLEYKKDNDIYTTDAFYPEKPFQLSGQTEIRGVNAVILGITPFQYNPVTKQLIVYRDVKVNISFENGNDHFGDDRLRSPWWDPIIRDAFLNESSIPEINYNSQSFNKDETGCEYLIITPNDAVFQQWADSIKKFRTNQGILTNIVTLAEIGGNNVNTIETYLNNAYNTWDIPPAACLIMADYGTNADDRIIAPIWDSYCASDNIWGDVNGNDMPDIVMARMTAQNATHLETMVTKILNYERTPPTSADFYNHPITALGFQTERWFQICSEAVAGFWENAQGKETVRINKTYQGSPNSDPWSTATNTSTVVNVFGPNGLGYIPATPGQVNCTWNGSANDVVNGINAGSFMLQHRDHGGEDGWGEPSFSNSNINSLNNTDLTFIWSINCLTGKYNISGECFAEKFHRYTKNGENSGCNGIVAASEVSYSFVNDTYVWGCYDNMWPDFLPDYGTTPDSRGVYPAFASAAGKYFLQQSSWPYNTSNKEVTYNLFHLHGDALMTVYSEVPQDLTVSHNPILYAGVTTFEVSANIGALIALTVDGEIIGTATGTGSPVSITIPGQVPPDQMLVTITLQNYYRYESLVDVIPPTGPYVVKDDYSINDVTGGNGNGLMDYGETNLLSLTVKNVGVQQADNVTVTLSTDDDYVTVTDATEDYGNIAAGATSVVTDGFAYDVANDLPDGHSVSFLVSATDGTNVWESYISIPGHAPVLEYVDFTISDAAGNNNGKIDPGETVDIIVNVENSGSSDAFNLVGELMATDPYLTVNTSSATYGDLGFGNSAEGTFSVTASASTPAGHMVDLTFEVNADLGITGSGAFNVVIGQIPVLILNLDGNNNTEPAMVAALTALGISHESVTSFPDDLNLYSTIFVCLGIYSQNHVLSSGEGQELADFMNAGGSVYMEGGDTWAYDNQTSAHAMFNINGEADGTSDMSTVAGQTGTFTEGMSFTYNGNNSYMDHLAPIGSAFLILENQSPVYGTGVAYDGGSYKTIGTAHEFGGLIDGSSPSTKEELMAKYLEFFGIGNTMTALFTADETEICVGNTVDFSDASTGQPISWEWTFEGGQPATSSMQNPTVMYFNVGTFDVTLEISDGTDFYSVTIEDYITVSDIPGTAGMPTGLTELCIDPMNTPYNTTGVTGVTEYEWKLEPANAGAITGTGTSATVDWDDTFTGDASVSVAGVNYCGTGEFSDVLTVTVYELPEVTLDEFEMVCVYNPAFELTGGEPAGGTYTGNGVSNNMFDPEVAGLGTHTITYTYEDAFGCSNFAEQDIVVDACTGIGENNLEGVSVYPNPNNGTFKLKINLNSSDVVDIKIYNALNEVVYSKDNVETSQQFVQDINLNSYSKGLYYLQVTGSETNIVKKIIIQK